MPALPLSAEAPAVQLAIRGLTVRYGARIVLEDLSLDLARGEVFGVLGPNGSGKTTLLQAVAGLIRPQRGFLALRGAPLPLGDVRLRRVLGVVFQQPSLDLRLSAIENLLLGAALYGVPRSVARERARAQLSFAGLAERAREPVSRLSGGLRRRLELARVLLHEPEVLLLDEPTSGLDEVAFQRTWSQLRGIAVARGLSLLVTTHRPEEAERCDRLAVLDGGQFIACDTPERLRTRVAGDVVVLDADEPALLAALVRERFNIEPRVVEGQVILERDNGHQLIPRIVESLPPGRLRSVSLRRPSLADVFVHLTGRSLAGEHRAPSQGGAWETSGSGAEPGARLANASGMTGEHMACSTHGGAGGIGAEAGAGIATAISVTGGQRHSGPRSK